MNTRSNYFKFTAFMIVISLAVATTLSFLFVQDAYTANNTTISELVGVSRADFISYMENNSSKYLGTSYKSDWPAPTTYEHGPWYSKGYHPYDATPYNYYVSSTGGYGMNCAGFPARVFCDLGAEHTSLMQTWYNMHAWHWANADSLKKTLQNLGVQSKGFSSVSQMLNSGYLEKGDIIWMHSSSDSHVGIFWGDSSSDNKFWHSIYYKNSSVAGENMISDIYGKGSPSQFIVFKFENVGYLELTKVSSNGSISDNNICYNIEGITYDIFSDKACTQSVASMTTNSSGYAKSGALQTGTYYVKESKTNESYQLNGQVYTVSVRSGETAKVNGGQVSDTPVYDSGNLVIRKVDSKHYALSSDDVPQGDAQLAGAQYTLNYYANTQGSTEGKATRSWTFETNREGAITLNSAAQKVAGDELYQNGDDIVYPRGTYTIQETKSPAGYLLDETLYGPIIVKADGDLSAGLKDLAKDYTSHDAALERPLSNEADDSSGTAARSNSKVSSVSFTDDVARGGVTLSKLDAETLKAWPQGLGDLGASFTIKNASPYAVIVNDTRYESGEDVLEITAKQTDAGWIATTDTDGDGVDNTLPYGSYEIRETHRPIAYEGTSTVITVKIRENGVVVTQGSLSTGEQIDLASSGFKNLPERANISWEKKDDSTSERMANVPFLISLLDENGDTLESHVVVSDKNGLVDTSKYRGETNKNDAALTQGSSTITVDEALLDYHNGVWFGITPHDGSISENLNNRGALLKGNYRVQEIACSANEGRQLVDVSIQVKSEDDNSMIDYGTLYDVEPSIETHAYNGITNDVHDSTFIIDRNTVIVDRVDYSDLIADGRTYTLTAELRDATSGEVILSEGSPVSTPIEFTPSKKTGYVNLSLQFDSRALADEQRVVVFETLSCNGRIEAEHADKDDIQQQMKALKPSIQTQASADDESKFVKLDIETALTDTVAYKHLLVGETYTLRCELMSKLSGETVLDAQGNAVTNEMSFSPEQQSGSIDINLTFDGTSLEDNEELVVFETLTKDSTGDIVAEHKDLEDEGQTVVSAKPQVATYAADKESGSSEAKINNAMSLTDTIEYWNLMPDKEYQVTGTLMLKVTNDDRTISAEPYIDKDGNQITGTSTFVPTSSHGFTDVLFQFNGLNLADNAQLVVYEVITREGVEIAKHEDPNDSNQTVTIHKPTIGTTATAADSNTHVLSATPSASITDRITYSGLIAGNHYVIHGSLQKKKTNKDDTVDASAFIDAQGNEIGGQLEFVPEESDGYVDVEFNFDASALTDGDELVVFESVTLDDVEICAHKDASDLGQTVTVEKAPPISTKASPKTGDTNQSTLILLSATALGALLVTLIAACVLKTKKRSQSSKQRPRKGFL